MTSIRGHKHFCKKHIFEGLLESSSLPKSRYDKLSVDFFIVDPIVDFLKFFITKYIEEDLQKILRMVLKTRVFFSNKLNEKSLKARLPDIYYNKSYIEYYNFYQ